MGMFLTSCATVNPQDRINKAASEKAEADQVDQAIEATTQLPDQPGDCKNNERSGVTDGDRLDVALVKTDRALSRANSRVQRCANWYEDLKQSRKGTETNVN